LNSRELAWFEVPSRGGDDGSEVEVSTSFGGSRSVWNGRVTRMEAQVDQSSRMVHVVVEVKDPYAASDDRPALLPGTFVDVRILGRTLDDVIPVPRHAVHEGNRLWIFDDGELQIRDVEVLHSDREQALVASGINDGELVIVSSLDAVTDGMKVRDAADQENLTPEVPSAEGPEDSARQLGSKGSPKANPTEPTAIRASELQGA
jgi:multidrug efflux pump subunit AcrA (membrane-fusion protein)